MARVIKETHTVEDSENTREVARADENGANIAARIVYIIAGVIITLLAFRFVLSLLGANRDNAFAELIYGMSYPFAAPFFGLFNYEAQYGVARFEVETLVAIAVYAFITWLIIRLIEVGANREVTVDK